jgi:hypothetical protein
MPGFPVDPSKLEVGFAFGADLSADPTTMTYTAVTSKVQPRVVITRGRVGDSTTTQPSNVDLGMLNANGEFSPRNIVGPHYGQLRRNTPMRVRVDTGSGFTTVGFGYIPDWNPTWAGPNIDDKLQVQASGVMRRLGQDGGLVRSPLRAGIPATNPLAYWGLEGDGPPVSGLSGGSSLDQDGQVQYGTQDGQAGSGPLPDFTGGGKLTGSLPAGASNTQWRLEFVARFGVGSDTISDAEFTVPVQLNSPSGNVNVWELLVSAGTAIVQWSDTSGGYVDLFDSGIAVDDGQWHHFRIDAAQSAAGTSLSR